MKKGMLLAAVMFLLMNVTHVHAAGLENSLSFKATVIENGVEYEWEYNNPDEYEYEHGNSVIKNDEARRKVMRIFQYLHISPDANVKNMVEHLKKDGHTDIERLQVRWIDSDQKLHTWVWNRAQQ